MHVVVSSSYPVAIKLAEVVASVHPAMRAVAIIREYALAFFALIVSIVSFAAFKWDISFSGKGGVTAGLSISLKQLMKWLPKGWCKPKIQVKVKCKLR